MIDRDKLIDFMLDPKNYPNKPNYIKHIETHISQVFIADDKVYKIKKPVNFGFLDFTTLAKRRFYCKREVELNSRLIKGLYLGVVTIYLTKEGHFSFDKKKGYSVAEYAVLMNYIPQDLILYEKIQNGDILYSQLMQIGAYIAHFHKTLSPKKTKESIYKNTVFSCEENFIQIEPYIGRTIDKACFDRLLQYTRQFLKENKKGFYERRKRGYVKEIHGDLHSQHICLTDPPIIFDCIEFNNRFRIDDVLNDIAFLLMDLEYNGRHDLSRAVRKGYEESYKDVIDQAFLKFYKVYRAVVRGKVEGFISDNLSGEQKDRIMKKARDYFHLADYYISKEADFNPVIFFGVPGTGKSSLAKEFSDKFVIIRSDEIRKEISGIKKTEHVYAGYGEGIYTSDFTMKTYETMINRMLEYVGSNKRVILDATFIKRWQRHKVVETCYKKGLNPFFVYCVTNEEILKKRIKERQTKGDDISDAHEEILLRQLREFEAPIEIPSFRIMKIDTSQGKEKIVSMLKEFL